MLRSKAGCLNKCCSKYLFISCSTHYVELSFYSPKMHLFIQHSARKRISTFPQMLSHSFDSGFDLFTFLYPSCPFLSHREYHYCRKHEKTQFCYTKWWCFSFHPQWIKWRLVMWKRRHLLCASPQLYGAVWHLSAHMFYVSLLYCLGLVSPLSSTSFSAVFSENLLTNSRNGHS